VAPKVLLVLSPPKRLRLLPWFEGRAFEIEWAVGFQDAVRKLSEGCFYDLLVVDAELHDGTWRNLLLFVQNSGMTSEMLICSRLPDQGLWADVIQCGAYDLITEPFERQEVLRIIQSALESRYMRRFSSTPKIRSAASPA
jgi:DNA-binding NtrC family response regulator